MKKTIFSIILFMMFIPFVVNAETCDIDKITISSITIESKSDSVVELDEATASGRNINLNISMSEVGDNISYKIVVKNDSKEDYQLDKNSFNISLDYIDYTLESEDNTNIVKANSSKIVYLKVNYANEVPDEAFESGTYNDNKIMTLNLSTGDTVSLTDTLKNPNTGVQSYILILFIVLLISITTYASLRKKKYAKIMILVIGIAIIIPPIRAYALCKCDIRIESKILIINHNHNVYVTNDYGWNTKQYLDNNYVSYDAFEERYFIVDGEKNIYYENGIKKIGKYKKGELVSTGTINLGKWCLESDFDNTHTCSNVQAVTLESSFYCETNDMCMAEDFNELNFSSTVSYQWGTYVKFPTDFTMPDHDVYFVINDG